jgi:CRP-like cAMP-binding protein
MLAPARLLGLPREFDALSEDVHQLLRSHARQQEAKRGQLVVGHSAASPGTLIVRNGLLTVSCRGRLGQAVVVDFLGAHDILSTALCTRACLYEVRAAGASSVWVVDVETWGKVLRSNLEFGLGLQSRQTRRSMAQHLHRARLCAMSNPCERIAYVLWCLGEPLCDEVGRTQRLLRHKLSQEVLGSFLNTSRSEVSRNMRDLETTGYLSRSAQGLLLSYESLALFSQFGNLGGNWSDPGPHV